VARTTYLGINGWTSDTHGILLLYQRYGVHDRNVGLNALLREQAPLFELQSYLALFPVTFDKRNVVNIAHYCFDVPTVDWLMTQILAQAEQQAELRDWIFRSYQFAAPTSNLVYLRYCNEQPLPLRGELALAYHESGGALKMPIGSYYPGDEEVAARAVIPPLFDTLRRTTNPAALDYLFARIRIEGNLDLVVNTTGIVPIDLMQLNRIYVYVERQMYDHLALYEEYREWAVAHRPPGNRVVNFNVPELVQLGPADDFERDEILANTTSPAILDAVFAQLPPDESELTAIYPFRPELLDYLVATQRFTPELYQRLIFMTRVDVVREVVQRGIMPPPTLYEMLEAANPFHPYYQELIATIHYSWDELAAGLRILRNLELLELVLAPYLGDH
jgi:hypothetical protein